MVDNILDIILVDGNPHDIGFALDTFKESNLVNRVMVLMDGGEAVDYIFRQGKYIDCGICEHPSVIILELNLPKIDGLEILRRIRANERTKAIPVVVLTSSLMDEDRIESYQLGANNYIVRPLDFGSFVEAVAQIGLYWAGLNKPPY